MGHVAIGTNSLDRAVHHLKHRGFEIDDSSRVDKKGTAIAVYLKHEISGFAFHLLQK
jgi:2-dehydro-3-deoxyphosphogluconate aldolase/(4S)-4-hydroxy-2-oxoglutarate aldolase